MTKPATNVKQVGAQGWAADDEHTRQIYAQRIAEYGHDFRALDWGSPESQQLRFAVLAQVGDLNGCSVLDVGCGLGDFLAWANRAGLEVNYTGLDITPGMIEGARAKHPRARFVTGDLLSFPAEPFDYVVESGIFTFRSENAMEYLKAYVRRMFESCRRGVAFNSLSGWAPDPEPGEFYADPLATLEFCRTLTPWVVLRHDYHARDFTIYLYRDRNR